jgi:hypothetical protein
MSSSTKQWYGSVIEYYGTLDKFPDARTVRIFIGFCNEWINEDNKLLKIAEDRGGIPLYDEIKEIFEEERTEITFILSELNKWMKDRDLTL